MLNSPKTIVYLSLFRNTKGNVKQMYDILSKVQSSGPISNVHVGGGGGGNVGNIGGGGGGGGGSQSLKWDKPHCGQGVSF